MELRGGEAGGVGVERVELGGGGEEWRVGAERVELRGGGEGLIGGAERVELRGGEAGGVGVERVTRVTSNHTVADNYSSVKSCRD